MAVDDSKVNMKAITKAVAKNIGTGKFKSVAREDALLNKEITVIRVRRWLNSNSGLSTKWTKSLSAKLEAWFAKNLVDGSEF